MDDECRRVLDELDVFLDCECAEHLARAVREHLHACGSCRSRADFERELRALIARRCRDAAPPSLMQRVVTVLATVHVEP